MVRSPLELHFGRFRELVAAAADRIEARRRGGMEGGGLAALLSRPVEVIVPSRAAAEALAAALLERSPRGIAGVELRTPERLAALVVNRSGAFPRVADEREQRIAMETAVRGVPPPLRDVEGLAPLLLRSWRDLRDSGVALARYVRHASKSTSDRRRARAVAAVWQRYAENLAKLGAIDPADLFEQASAALRASPSLAGPQIVFGFYDATGIQEQLLFDVHRAAGIDSIWIPAELREGELGEESEFARRFVESVERLGRSDGGEVERREHGGGESASWEIRSHATRGQEVRETLAAVREAIDEGVAPEEIAIVARSIDDELAALVAREAPAYGLTVTARRGRPLASHPWGRAVRDLLRLRSERFHREVVVELAAAPFVRGTMPDEARPAELDEAARRAEIAGGDSRAIRRILPRLDDRARLAEGVRLWAETVEALERLSEGTDQTRPAAVWAEWLEGILGRLRVDAPEDLDALEALLAIVALLRRAARFGARLSAEQLSALVTSAPDLPERPAGPDSEPSPSPVWFGDVMAFRGRTFRRLFAIAMQQELFPQRRTEDILFTNEERKALLVREIDDGRSEETFLFRLLREGATERIRFSIAGGDGGRKSYRPSVLLKRLALAGAVTMEERRRIVSDFEGWVRERGGEPAGARRAAVAAARAILGGAPLGEPLARQLLLAARAGTASPFDGFLPPEPALEESVRARLASLSPRRLEIFGECPHRFFLQTVLRVEEVEEPEWELEITARKKGLLDHVILERFYRDLPEGEIAAMEGAIRLSEPLRGRLRSLVDEEYDGYERRYPALTPLLRRVERKLALRILEEFLVADLADLAATGLRPWRFELTFGIPREDGSPSEHEGVLLPIRGAEVRLRGRIDRVDRTPDGSRWRIVDYKRGRGARYSKLAERIDRGHALQIALYALAVAQLFDLRLDQIDAAIKPIRSEERAEKFTVSMRDHAAGLETILELFARAILGGRFPAVVSSPRRGDHCQWCAVSSWCRTRHTPEEAWATSRFESAARLLEAHETRANPEEETA